MSEYIEIIELKNGPVKYEWTNEASIKMVGHTYPYSLKEEEFFYLRDIIIKYNLKTGYELATAFGVSTTAIGLGFKQTGGKLVTMDAYVEEHCDSWLVYRDMPPQVYPDKDGYKSANHLIKHFGLEDHVITEVGWSPNNTEEVIKKHLTDKIDFVFIDGGHFPDQVIKDVEVLIPMLADKYLIAFHDNYPQVFDHKVNDFLMRNFGKLPEIVVAPPTGYNLSIITNI
jgi:predicted O-methyltransferase YrrM